jgi:hypothetical protein
MICRRYWTVKEVEYLKENTKVPLSHIARDLNRSVTSVKTKRIKLGLALSKSEKGTELRRKVVVLNAKGLSDRQIARELKISCKTTRNIRYKLKLKSNEPKNYRNSPTKKIKLEKKEPISNHTADMNYYEIEESEYLKAIAKFRNIHNRPPTLIEGYRVAISLGYVKQ